MSAASPFDSGLAQDPGDRKEQQDRAALIVHPAAGDVLLVVVADGMGGRLCGAQSAAQVVVQTLAEAFRREAAPRLANPFVFMQQAILAAHRAILDYATRHRLGDAPRTTCVACVVQDNQAYWAHAGDSRLLLLRRGRVLAQTRDHSRVRLLVDQGRISAAEAARHPERNIIYNCLGSPTPPDVEFSRRTPLEHGDLLVLCTDGVWGLASGAELAAALGHGDLMQSVPALLDRCEAKGGPHRDNLSLVAVRWEDTYLDSLASASISTQGMGDGEVATQLDQFGHNPAHKSELTDDDIEKAIAEIRAAIDKCNPQK